jgi:hypothetical protein
MKGLCFGNPHSDHIEFQLGEIAIAESCVTAEGSLQAGWFSAVLPLVVAFSAVEKFVAELGVVDQSLSGSALLRSTGPNGPISINLEALPLGHILCSIDARLDENSLVCSFRTDQTQLRALLIWWQGLQQRCEKLAATH